MLLSNQQDGGAAFRLARLLSLVSLWFLVTLGTSVSFADDMPKESSNVPSASGPIKKNLLLKPYLVFGYNMQELFSRDNTATDPFFTELSKFHNWRIGLGFRITSFLSMELIYSSMARTFTATDSDLSALGVPNPASETSKQVNMLASMVYFVGTFYTPAIDIKFGTLEFAASVGIAGIFGFNYGYSGNNQDEYSLSIPGSPQFMGGVALIFGFPKFVSLRVFADIITLGHEQINIPVLMNYGVAINIYLL